MHCSKVLIRAVNNWLPVSNSDLAGKPYNASRWNRALVCNEAFRDSGVARSELSRCAMARRAMDDNERTLRIPFRALPP